MGEHRADYGLSSRNQISFQRIALLEFAHAVMERVDAKGRVIGFSVMGVSKFKKSNPLEADLVAA